MFYRLVSLLFLFQVKTIAWDLGEIGNGQNYESFEKMLSQTTKGKMNEARMS